jgi:LPXTG-motif cell wall-anchored protein
MVIAAMIVLVTTGESTPPAIMWAGVVVLAASWAIIAVG